jgi:hypothetical protein
MQRKDCSSTALPLPDPTPPRVKSIVSVHELFESLKREFQEAVKRSPDFLATAS